jgi:cobalt-zinc-cadmium efflux system protein
VSPAHGPDHAAPGGVSRGDQTRCLGRAIALTAAVLVIEVIGGIVSGSLALISDAGHMLTDVLALTLSLMAARFAALPPNPAKTWGYHRLEILTALFNGALLLCLSSWLLYRAFRRLLVPVPVEGPLMTGVALAGLLTNVVSVAVLSRGGHSLNLKAARMHVIGDALSSLGVVVAGVVIAVTGWHRMDPAVAAIIAVVIIVGAVRLGREAVDVLLESTPAGIDLDAVGGAIGAIPGVVEVHDLHVWSLTTGNHALSGHVRVADPERVDPDQILNRIKRSLRDRFGIVHTTIQIESPTYQELGDVH